MSLIGVSCGLACIAATTRLDSWIEPLDGLIGSPSAERHVRPGTLLHRTRSPLVDARPRAGECYERP